MPTYEIYKIKKQRVFFLRGWRAVNTEVAHKDLLSYNAVALSYDVDRGILFQYFTNYFCDSPDNTLLRLPQTPQLCLI